jgi:hypothetical protein
VTRPTFRHEKGESLTRQCNHDETQQAVELYEWLRCAPVAGRAEGFLLRMDYASQILDTVYIETPGAADRVRVLSIMRAGWQSSSHVPPERIQWNPLPPSGDVHVFEFFTRRRLLH